MSRSVVVDSNILIDHFNGIALAGNELAYHANIVISAITWIEVMSAFEAKRAAKTISEHEYDACKLVLSAFKVIDIDTPVMAESARLRGCSLARGRKLAVPDAIIKATANVIGSVLISRNTKDFSGPDVRLPYMVEVRARSGASTTLFTPVSDIVTTVTYIAFPPAPN